MKFLLLIVGLLLFTTESFSLSYVEKLKLKEKYQSNIISAQENGNYEDAILWMTKMAMLGPSMSRKTVMGRNVEELYNSAEVSFVRKEYDVAFYLFEVCEKKGGFNQSAYFLSLSKTDNGYELLKIADSKLGNKEHIKYATAAFTYISDKYQSSKLGKIAKEQLVKIDRWVDVYNQQVNIANSQRRIQVKNCEQRKKSCLAQCEGYSNDSASWLETSPRRKCIDGCYDITCY